MALSDVRTIMLGILNRRDANIVPLANTFIRQGQSRIEKTLRVPDMETVYTTTAGAYGLSQFTLPTDFLEAKDLFVDSSPVDKITYRQLLPWGAQPLGSPQGYARVGSTVYLAPGASPQAVVLLTYYAKLKALSVDTDTNILTNDYPDLLAYQALAFAGDYFKHDNADAWASKAATLLAEAMDQAAMLDLTGGGLTIQPAHSGY